MKNTLSLVLVSGILVTAGCAHRSATGEKAPKATSASAASVAVTAPAPTAGRAVIYVLFDRGIATGVDDRETTQRQQVGDYMERDLVRALTKAGYAAKAIAKRAEFTAVADNYLLTVKIVRYNPGAKAARYVVGYGAGAASLDIHYELTGAKNDAVLSKDDGVGSSRDWQFCCRKLNQNMTQAIKGALGGG